MKISVVVPTIRPEQYNDFKKAWQPLFEEHGVTLWVVRDGKKPTVNGRSIREVMGRKYADLIYNFNDGVRNLGFAAAWQADADVIISLDDDTRPYGDTIGDHLYSLGQRFPVSWMNTVDDVYMRGFPYSVREEAECVFSHGVWNGVYDLDASSQLLFGKDIAPPHRRMPVPRGTLFPVCAMNVAFKRSVLPYYYQAPLFGDINRFADIWAGIEMKRAIDRRGECAVTGYATVRHERASDPFQNLIKEAKGVQMNENYGEGEYFKMYTEKIRRWQEFLQKC